MLIFFDFDSTVITKESLDEVIAWKLKDHPDRKSLNNKIDQITNQGMDGSMPFTQSVTKRFEVVKLNAQDFETVGTSFLNHITPGMEALFEKLQKDHTIFIISGGFLPSLYVVSDRLGIPRSQVLANDFLKNNPNEPLKPNTQNPMWTNEGKGEGIKSLLSDNDMEKSKTVLIGDGANDLNTWLNGHVDEFVGFGVNVVRESVKNNAPYFVTQMRELEKILRELPDLSIYSKK